jgi:hypothetical protein
MIKPRRLLTDEETADVRMVRMPKLSDRVVIAAGEDAATGSKKLGQLLDQIAKDLAPKLTPKETSSLRDVHDGRFKKKPGQHNGDRRFVQGIHAQQLSEWLKKLKDYLKHDPQEKTLKHLGHYDLNQRTAERAHQLLQERKLKRQQEYGDDYVDTPTPSVAALRKKLRGG